jgi:hypothetical protein
MKAKELCGLEEFQQPGLLLLLDLSFPRSEFPKRLQQRARARFLFPGAAGVLKLPPKYDPILQELKTPRVMAVKDRLNPRPRLGVEFELLHDPPFVVRAESLQHLFSWEESIPRAVLRRSGLRGEPQDKRNQKSAEEGGPDGCARTDFPHGESSIKRASSIGSESSSKSGAPAIDHNSSSNPSAQDQRGSVSDGRSGALRPRRAPPPSERRKTAAAAPMALHHDGIRGRGAGRLESRSSSRLEGAMGRARAMRSIRIRSSSEKEKAGEASRPRASSGPSGGTRFIQ